MTPTELEDAAGAALDAAKAAGADAADVLTVAGTSVSIDVLNGALEHAERSEAVDIGLRVLIGQRQAIASASDLSAATISELAERAVTMAKLAPEDPHLGLADPDQLAKRPDASALELADPTEPPEPDVLQQEAVRPEAAAMEVPGVEQTQGASGA